MGRNFEARLRAVVAEVERSDEELAKELRAVRAAPADKAAVNEVAPRLTALGPAGAPDAGRLLPETIVLRTGRPVLAVVNDEARLVFDDVDSEVWRARLVAARELLGRAIPAAGRIEVENHDLDWLGTGWLVADDIVVTNRHVAGEFGRRRGEGFVFRQGLLGPMAARVDFREEIEGGAAAREFKLSKILHIENEDGPDVAFLRVDPGERDPRAAPIPLSTKAVRATQQVAVIGYPARDSRIPEQDLMSRIFGDVFDKKRLAPGQVKGLQDGLVLHDCSTLGGNSGSVVLDLETGEAVALHFAGRFLEANFAVPAQTVARLLRDVREGVSAPRPSPAPPRPQPSPAAGPAANLTSTSITIPVRIRVEVGAPQADIANAATSSSRASSATVVAVDADDDDEFAEEARPEDYADREGYAAGFLGVEVPLPGIRDEGDVLTFRLDGRTERELKYEHFSVVMSRSRRLSRYSAVNLDGAQTRKVKRPGWRTDPRIGIAQQIKSECYGNEPRFSRGHMTRRADPIWGTPAVAARGNSDSMHVTNAVPQMQPFNAGIWLGLEDYALEHARQDDMRISVFTGPVLREDDPLRFGVQIPTTFWKVIAFIHDETGDPCVTGYTLAQDDFLREEEFVFGRHETTQVPLSVIEAMAGVSFPSELRRLDPLERVHEARPRPLRDHREIRFR